MDKEQKQPEIKDDNWLDEILGTEDTPKELGPDELAVQAAGLTHPDDLELEKILAEDWKNVPDLELIEEVSALPPETNLAEQSDASQSIDSVTDATQGSIPSASPAEDGTPEEAAENEDATIYFAPVAVTQVITPQELQDLQSPVQALEETPAENKPKVRKIRPAPKKGYGLFGIPHILATCIWLIVIMIVGLTLGHTLWSGITDLMAFGKPDQQITITITEEDVKVMPDGTKVVDIDAIANKLKDAGLIEKPIWFKLFADTLTDKAYDIDPGTYTLNSKFDYNALINNMQSYESAREEVELLIPEGYTCAQIFQLLEENGVCSVADLEAYVLACGEAGMNGGEYALSDYWFLEDAPRADKYWLEGYLFPDTYRFFIDDTPENVIRKFLDGFNFRFTDVMRTKLENLNAQTGLDIGIREVIIIASMIEKETANADDSYMISSVIYNRLTDPTHNWHLNIDATIYYALGGNIDPETGLPKPLTTEDMAIDHPYNTYLYTGLPPGAISNPGRNSLDAALTPDQHSYPYYIFTNGKVVKVESIEEDKYSNMLFYVFNPVDGVHIFSKTQEDQDKAIEYIKTLE